MRRLAVEPLLEGPLPFRLALLEGVEGLLELKPLDIGPGALDQLLHLRSVRAELPHRLRKPLGVDQRAVDLCPQLPRYGLEALLREPYRDLEIVRLHGGAGAGQQVLDGPRVPA